MIKISALILVKNEEDLIEECLQQLDFVDEIIVLDQNSNDKTISIAKKYTKNILISNKSNFAKNRITLANAASGEWLLYVDSDERYSEKLKKEITYKIVDKSISTYYFPRKNYILGKWMKHGGYWPDFVPKLIRKKALKTWKGKVHESPIYIGKSSKFKEPIEHLTARTISQMLNKTITWANVEAHLAYKANHSKVNSVKVIKVFLSEFISRYFIKLALLDGVVGFIQALFQAYHKSITLIYLWELQNNSRKINNF